MFAHAGAKVMIATRTARHGEATAGNIAKAVIWGLILGTLSSVWWINLFPNLAGPGVNAGLFFSNFGPNQLSWVVAVYLWHIVYGINLGLFYNPKDLPETTEATEATAV